MAVVNHSGAQATLTWNTVADEHHLTAECTAGAGVTITWASGASANPIRFDGAFRFIFSATASLLMTGTSATIRQRYQPNGAATTWVRANSTYVFMSGNTGTITISYLDMYISGLLYDPALSTSTVTGLRVFGTGNSTVVARMNPTAGTHTWTDIELWSDMAAVNFEMSPTGGTNSITNILLYGTGGVTLSPAAGTNSITKMKIVRSTNGVTASGVGKVTVTDLAVIETTN